MLAIKLTASIVLSYLIELFISSRRYIPTQFYDTFPVLMGINCALLGCFICITLKLKRKNLMIVSVCCFTLGIMLGFLRVTKIKDDHIDKRYSRSCNVEVVSDYPPPLRSNRDKFIAAQRACEASVCTSNDCCEKVLELNYNSTTKIHGSILERDCLMLLSDKCESNRIEYTNRVMQYLTTLGDGSPCPACSNKQMSGNEIKQIIDVDNTDSVTLNQSKIEFVKTLSDINWSVVAGETITSTDGTSTTFSGCEYCDTLNLFNLWGPVSQVRHWMKQLMNRSNALPPVCSTCIETVADLIDCLGAESPDNIFAEDPMLLEDVKYSLSFQSTDEKLDKRPECFTEYAPESCINIRLSRFEKFLDKCIDHGESSRCI